MAIKLINSSHTDFHIILYKSEAKQGQKSLRFMSIWMPNLFGLVLFRSTLEIPYLMQFFKKHHLKQYNLKIQKNYKTNIVDKNVTFN